MVFEIIKDFSIWNTIYNSFPSFPGKIYYSSDYCNAIKNNLEGEPLLNYFEIDYLNKKIKIIYPFILKEIPNCITKILSSDTFYDIESPYGYGGPLVFIENFYNYKKENNIEEVIKSYTKEFIKWAKNNNIIAEFVRFNPFTENHKYFINDYKTELNRKTISINTTTTFESMLSKATSARRRNYFKAIKSGLKIRWNPINNIEEMQIFRTIYNMTMNRLNADNYYFFSNEYFNKLSNLKDKGLIATALYNDNPVASSIFLLDDYYTHYHLGGSDYSFKNLQCSSFLLWEAAKKANELNLKFLHLGGGLSLDSNDKLFLYKKGFSKNIHDFYIGKRIINPKIYNDISCIWQKTTNKKPIKLLHYHEI